MKNREPVRSSHSALTIEPLESRIAPAGLVKVAIAAGVLTLTDDAAVPLA